MDQSLRLDAVFIVDLSISRFNPCCLGSVSSTLLRGQNRVLFCGFQSLLSWISLFDTAQTNPYSSRRMFQSLLSWISLFDIESWMVMIDAPMKFQSLLSWISLFDLIAPTRASTSPGGFNPCCLGSVSSTSTQDLDAVPPVRVSILVVLDQSLRL